MAKPIIFISHISKEAGLAEIFKNNIRKDFLGLIDVFVSSDSSSIQLGVKWLEEVDKNLKVAVIELVLCSRDSVHRPWINFEAGGGWVRGIPIVPICHTDMKPTELPIPLNMLEAILANDASGINKLYLLISKTIGATSPPADFDSFVSQVKEMEKTYKTNKMADVLESKSPPVDTEFPSMARILKPNILCASSAQFETLGFEKDLATIESYFPHQLTKLTHITSKKMRNILSEEKFDILHILALIAKNGDMIFGNGIDVAKSSRDFISAEGFAKLIEISEIKLVILATCDSLPLAASLNQKTNLIAAMDVINIDEIIDWEDCFYGFLSKGFSITKSYELSKSLHSLPMILIPAKDYAFAPEI